MSDRRITPDDVLAAYAKTGLRPIFGDWCDIGCGCPLTALYVAETNAVSFDSAAVRIWAGIAFGQLFVSGFTIAADETPERISYAPRWHQGYADGLAVRKAIIEAGLMEAVA